MKKNFLKVLGIAAALLLNVACSASNNASVWSNSDYGSGSAAPKAVKSANGITILN